MATTVYSKPACVQCNSTYKKLDKKGVEYVTVDVSQDAEAFSYITEELGYSAVPVVVTDDDHWAGYNPEKIAQIS